MLDKGVVEWTIRPPTLLKLSPLTSWSITPPNDDYVYADGYEVFNLPFPIVSQARQ